MPNSIRPLSACVFAGLLVACVPTREALLNDPGDVQTFSYTANYQEVFRRVNSTAANCLETGMLIAWQASWEVDGQLYNELGYGEIDFYLNNIKKDFYATVRIQRDGRGSKMKVSTRKMFARSLIPKFERWAKGSTAC